MRSKFTTLLTVLGAVTVLVLAANTVALATTGKAILAGKINTSSKMTAIVRTTPGTGLQVKTKSTANAPFAVNGKGKVVNLNADTVDGLDSVNLRTKGLVWAWAGSTSSSSTRTWTTTQIPSGAYLFNYEVFLGPGSGAGVTDCFLSRVGSSLYAGEGSASLNGYGISLANAGLVVLPTAGKVSLTCNSANAHTWAVGQSQPVRITGVPLPNYVLVGSPAVS